MAAFLGRLARGRRASYGALRRRCAKQHPTHKHFFSQSRGRAVAAGTRPWLRANGLMLAVLSAAAAACATQTDDASSASLEEQALQEGGPRIKFTTKRVVDPTVLTGLTEEAGEVYGMLTDLSELLSEMEQYGAAPVLPDGKVGGNAAVMVPISRGKTLLLVSRSGKTAGQQLTPSDWCAIRAFSYREWHCQYTSTHPDVRPSSDTPLLAESLLYGPDAFGWPERPVVALHGHALETEEAATALSLPISHKETLFSTREDVAALTALFQRHPYPQHRVFIRKGHGFFLLASSVAEARTLFRERIVPHL